MPLPRSGDAFDLLLGYAELTRERYRVRLGRLRNAAGLGFSGYDGAEVRVDVLDDFRVTGYAGRSLAPGLEEGRESALDPVEVFVPDRSSVLVGGAHRRSSPCSACCAAARTRRHRRRSTRPASRTDRTARPGTKTGAAASAPRARR